VLLSGSIGGLGYFFWLLTRIQSCLGGAGWEKGLLLIHLPGKVLLLPPSVHHYQLLKFTYVWFGGCQDLVRGPHSWPPKRRIQCVLLVLLFFRVMRCNVSSSLNSKTLLFSRRMKKISSNAWRIPQTTPLYISILCAFHSFSLFLLLTTMMIIDDSFTSLVFNQ
jgi:hypothetical protein